MLTRLEVDGFKNLRTFAVDFGPYTCIVGPNAIGKSNVFDAIAFLSATASSSFNDAAAHLRGKQGDLREVFGEGSEGPRRMTFAAEMIVNPTFIDDLNSPVEVNHTYVRYELDIELVDVDVAAGVKASTIALREERLMPLLKGDAKQRLAWASSAFLESALKSKGNKKTIIDTVDSGEPNAKIEISSGGKGRNSQVYLREPQTGEPVASSVLSVFGRRSDYPLVAAVRHEMMTWMLLALEPSAMRSPNEATGPSSIDERGFNMPRTLARLEARTGGQSKTALLDIVEDLVDVRDIDVDFDEGRQLFTLRARIGTARMLPARALSDGTLRFIALGLLQVDPDTRGVICYEEPENGIYPDKLPAMYGLLHNLAVDPLRPVSADNPLRQVIVNSHSPAYMYLHREHVDELLIGDQHPLLGSLQLRHVMAEKNWRNKDSRTLGVLRGRFREMLEGAFVGVDFAQTARSVTTSSSTAASDDVAAEDQHAG